MEIEIYKLVNSDKWQDRLKAAKKGYMLNILVKDEDPDVKVAVAEQGYGLDKLVYDEHPDVRAAVARQGYGLDILINDRESRVRAEVAEQRFKLDILINDKDEYVRKIAKENLNRSHMEKIFVRFFEEMQQNYPDVKIKLLEISEEGKHLIYSLNKKLIYQQFTGKEIALKYIKHSIIDENQ